MKKILHTLLFMSAIQFTNAQYVAIPDSGFRVWLNNNGYSACMSGNNLDTNCAALASVTILSFYAPSPPINDYTGLQYFKNMLHLAFFQITANKIPLPPNLTYLSIFFDTSLVSIPSLPDSITFLQIENTDITQLPPLPSALWIIYCGDNLLTSLPPLPASLHQLECVDNQITSLPSLRRWTGFLVHAATTLFPFFLHCPMFFGSFIAMAILALPAFRIHCTIWTN